MIIDHPRSAGVEPDPSQRYGQLTYTSFDGQGMGGWQVKEQRGLSPVEQDQLRSRIDPQLDTGTELPRFPSPQDVAQFPRRLVFGPRPFGVAEAGAETGAEAGVVAAVAWWHHAAAGLDGSGRPGNVFTHILIDRSPAHPVESQLAGHHSGRPIDLWRSPGWLTPYGADAVLAATLGSGQPGPGEMVTVERLVAFLLDLSHYRLGVLSVLLDACAAAVNGGRPVVLACQSTDSAAWWVAAVSYLMPPAAADRFAFSTLERLPSLPSRFAQGIGLCCVPRPDYEHLCEQDRDFVLIAEDESVSMGDLDGEPHVTTAGDHIAVTEWSVLANVLLIDEPTAVWALSQLDQVALALDDPSDSRPELAWPLAMVVARAPDHFRDAVSEASRVLIRRSPAGLRASAELFESARSLIADGVGSTTRQAWTPLERALTPGEPPSVMAEMLLNIYVTRAVADLLWLVEPGGARVPAPLWGNGDCPAVVTEALAAAVETLVAAAPQDQTSARALAALTNFAVQLNLLTTELLDRVSVGLEGGFVHLLFEPQADALVDSLGPYAEETLERVFRPLVNNSIGLDPNPPGQRLSQKVLAWLFARGAEHQLPLPHEPYEEFRLRGELAVQWVRKDPLTRAADRPLAAIALLEEGGGVAEVEGLFAAPTWSVTDLEAIEARFPRRLPLRLFAPTFKASAAGPALDDLANLVLRTRRTGEAYEPYGPGDLIRMRISADDAWRSRQRFPERLALVLTGAIHALEYVEVPFHHDAIDQIHGAMVLSIAGGIGLRGANGPTVDNVKRLIRDGEKPAGPARAGVWQMVSEGARAQLKLEQVVVAALLGEQDFPEPTVSDALYQWAHRLRVEVEGVQGPILRQYVVREVAEGTETFDELLSRVRDQLWPKVRRTPNPERSYRLCGKFAHSWLKPLFPAEGLLGRLW